MSRVHHPIAESLLAVVVAFASAPVSAQFHDDFTGKTLDKAWTWTDPGSDASFKLLPGTFRMIVPPGNDHTTGHKAPLYAGPMLTVKTAGDFTITTFVTVNYPRVPSAKESGLMIWKDRSNNLQFKRTNAFNAQNVLTYGNIANTQTTFHGNVNVAATALFLQIRRVGSAFTSHYSTDGKSWTQAGSVTWSVTGTLNVGIATSYWLWFGSSTVPATGDYLFFDLDKPGAVLRVDRAGVSAATGGTIGLHLDRGKAGAGLNYILVGSVSGSSPGTPLPGGILPLNWDPLTDLMLSLRNLASTFPGTAGKLDASGKALGQVIIPPNTVAALIGVSLRFAGVTFASATSPLLPTNAAEVAVTK